MSETTPAEIIVGVDTHKHIHAAVAISPLGARLGSTTIPVDGKGYRALETWARSLGPIRAFGVEGTGSYGAGLSRFLREQGHDVFEVNRPNRQLRHQKGKSDPLDAEGAARAVLAGQVTALPKSGTGTAEMIRHLKTARDTAVKGRSQAMLTLKAIIVGAPVALREQLDALTGKMALVRHLAALRPGPITSTTASAKASLRAIARRWLALDDGIKAHDVHLAQLTKQRASELVKAHGMGPGIAAEMLLLVGANPERIRSEAALAKLCGACPIPASSGKTNRHRLNRGGNRQANAALYRVVITRMRGHQPTLDYVRRRTAEGKSKAEIIRCLKRYVVREIFGYLCAKPEPVNARPAA
ncbi:IS110 family transposase [Methylobacterium isbiliense]|uniref:IS110 family transposase n=1 Tax=Methylobacterium isbiliense TaxID=315478 RepID=UPI0025B33F50|nr:IS110 family transposase [Methylobacterium isbiliense]MDN3626869.1 IS110 family transposase [Methylobacterium isbiliense]